MTWSLQRIWRKAVRQRNGDARVVVISGEEDGRFYAVGLTTPTPGGGVDEVLDNHSHENLGDFGTLAEAQRAGVRFLRGRSPATRCACKPVEH